MISNFDAVAFLSFHKFLKSKYSALISYSRVRISKRAASISINPRKLSQLIFQVNLQAEIIAKMGIKISS